MFKGFKSIEDMLDLFKEGGFDVRRRMLVMSLIKDNITASGKDGVTHLRSIAYDFMNERDFEFVFAVDESLSDALRAGANAASLEGGDRSLRGPFRSVLVKFFSEIGFLDTFENSLSQNSGSERQQQVSADAQTSVTARTAPNVTPTVVSLFPSAAASKPEHNGGDQPEVFCPLDDYAGQVFSFKVEATSKAPIPDGALMKLPGILPPSPLGGSSNAYANWLDGNIFHRLNFNISVALGEEDSPADLIEMLSEFHALPEAACQTYRARKPVDPAAGDAASLLLYHSAKSLGFQGHTIEMAHTKFGTSVMDYFNQFEPLNAAFLNRNGCDIKCDASFAVVLASALDIEKFFLENGPDGAQQGTPYAGQGSLASNSRLDLPYIMNRAIFSHLSYAIPMADTLVKSLTELRHAQLCRYTGTEISTTDFDAQYQEDWFFDLNEYQIEENSTPNPM